MCKHLGIDPETELLALGDQENDIGMLKMAAIGVSVGNGSPIAKEAADYVMEMTSNEGAAGVAMNRFAGFMQQQQQQQQPESTAS
jgi:hydroxymethylpyrimidine pyrophosphatase-like HAD family hydrolase